MKSHPRQRQREVHVSVLGAGIAGLSAAHELVRRGFKVTVLEKACGRMTPNPGLPIVDQYDPKRKDMRFEPTVGGVARTQWTSVAHESPSDTGANPEVRVHATQSLGGLGSFILEKAGEHEIQMQGGDGSWHAVPFKRGSNSEFGNLETLKSWYTANRNKGRLQLVGLTFLADPYATHQDTQSLASILGIENTCRRLAKAGADLEGRSMPKGEGSADLLPTTLVDYPLDSEDTKLLSTAEEFPGALLRVHQPDSEAVTNAGNRDVGFLPGEHGFRFFPGFYRHLRELLREITIYDTQAGRFTDRTVHDNLIEVDWQVMTDPTRLAPTAFRRHPPESAQEFLEQWYTIRNDLGFRDADMLRFVLRLARFATSSDRRRERQYERITWWDFLSLERLDHVPPAPRDEVASRYKISDTHKRLSYGVRIERALKHSPRALVAMDADVTDAHTQGNLAIQLAFDQLGLNEMTDSVLNGPSSEAWFEHWYNYLEKRGVKFIAGEVTKLDLVAGTAEYIDFETGERRSVQKNEGDGRADYIVCALDPVATERVLVLPDQHEVVPESTLRFIERYRDWVQRPGPDREVRNPQRLAPEPDVGDRFQLLGGMQFFFERPVSFADAHLYFGESPWGIMAVSQFQFWDRWLSENWGGSRFVSNLSLVWGAWREPPKLDDRIKTLICRAQAVYKPRTAVLKYDRAWLSPSSYAPRGLAHETREQLAWCMGTTAQFDPDLHIPSAYAFHIDDYIQFRRTAKEGEDPLPIWNLSPYPINVVGDWDSRPTGEPWDPHARKNRRKGAPPDGYVLHGKGARVVFAGAHMRTFTRMATMESAAESARHAVNKILNNLDDEVRGRAGTSDPNMSAVHSGAPPEAGAGVHDGDRGELKQRLLEFGGSTTAEATASHFRKRGGPISKVKAQDTPMYRTTHFGDYCRVWDPRRFELPSLDFWKRIDEELLKAAGQREMPEDGRHPYPDDIPNNEAYTPRYPHVFDLIGLDKLPKQVEDSDLSIEQTFDLLTAVLQAAKKAIQSDDPASAVRALLTAIDNVIR
ncbi:MAG: NAD(P)-binding protein [Deltaproteobacteria bacterium]|nr:NAD(P)-binding protein [Deltaproteobacteria bacterium]